MTSTEESKIHEDLMFKEENHPDEYRQIQKDYMGRHSNRLRNFIRQGYLFKTVCDIDELDEIEKSLIKEGYDLKFDYNPSNPFDYSTIPHHVAIFGRKSN